MFQSIYQISFRIQETQDGKNQKRLFVNVVGTQLHSHCDSITISFSFLLYTCRYKNL